MFMYGMEDDVIRKKVWIASSARQRRRGFGVLDFGVSALLAWHVLQVPKHVPRYTTIRPLPRYNSSVSLR